MKGKALNLFRTASGLFVPAGSAAAPAPEAPAPAAKGGSEKNPEPAPLPGIDERDAKRLAAGDALRKTLEKVAAPRAPKERRTAWALPPGQEWNPLKNFPRNNACFCGSGVKAKRCCIPSMSQCISAKNAAKVRNAWEALVAGELTLKQAILKECPLESRGLMRKVRLRESLRAARIEAERELARASDQVEAEAATKTAHASEGDPKP